jgi:hypothetical protein
VLYEALAHTVMREEGRRLMKEVKGFVSSKCSHGHVDAEILHLDRMVDLPFHKGYTFGPWTNPYLKGSTIKTVSMASKERNLTTGTNFDLFLAAVVTFCHRPFGLFLQNF